MTTLSQRDTRWASVKLGFSSTSTIGNYGCLITCFSMIAGLNPDDLNAKLKAVDGFTNDLVIWSKVKEAIPFDFSPTQAYDNEAVKAQIEKNGFCIVRVDYDGKISTPSDTHFVLYIGDQQMIDPWTGVQKSTGWYPTVTGYCACTKVNTIDPTLPWLRQMYQVKSIDLSQPEGTVRGKVQEIFDGNDKYQEAIKLKDKALADLAEARGDATKWEENYNNASKQITELKKEIEDLNTKVSARDSEITTLQARVGALEKQLDPDKVIVVTREEYAKLTAKKTLDKFSSGELIQEIFKRLFKGGES